MSLIKVVCYVLRVKNMYLKSPSDPSGTAAAEAKPKRVYSILKPHGQCSRCQVRLLLPRCVYSILKPHGQSFITSPGVGPKQLCALAHLGCTCAAGTSYNPYFISYREKWVYLFCHGCIFNGLHFCFEDRKLYVINKYVVKSNIICCR